MKYGNCVIGAVVLAFKHRFRGKFIVEWPADRITPHMLYEVGNYQHHYRCKRDCLPWPLYYLAFQGKFSRRRKR